MTYLRTEVHTPNSNGFLVIPVTPNTEASLRRHVPNRKLVMPIFIFLVIILRNPVKVNRRFGETHRRHLCLLSLLPSSCWFRVWLTLRS
jgi:hypothetical protein